MSVEVAFTRSSRVVSRLIRAVTREDVSHVVVILDDRWVIHSNFAGVHVEYLWDFLETSEIVTRLPVLFPRERVYEALDKYHESGYDFGGMLFVGGALLLRRLFPRYIPKQNLWQVSGMFLCTEFVTRILSGKENSLITPGQLRTYLEHKQSTGL